MHPFLRARNMKTVQSFDYLAVGEDVSTTSVEAVRHWTEFYRELASFDQTVRRLKRQVGAFSGEQRKVAVAEALPRLIADTEDFERRFDFWEGRLGQFS